jgi:CheY-like chemotaxis protein/tetratricopeptide (TPR) repeat protein
MSRILLIEDDKYLNKLLSDRLMIEGHQVTSMLDGESAWTEFEQSCAREEFYDVVVSDMLLPRLMGAELFSNINQFKSTHRVRLIAMSGIYKNHDEIRDLTNLYNIEHYLVKPFSLQTFLATVSGSETEQQLPELGSGLLTDRPIETLLIEAYTRGHTGKLLLKRNSIERRVYFLNGFPVSADSTSIGESLGKSLVSLGIIDEQSNELASRLMVQEKMQFGQTLIKMGKLTKDQLFEALRKHTQRLLLNMFLWRDGEFQFEPATELPKHIMPLEFNPLLLIRKAHRSMYSSDFIFSLFSTKQDQYCNCDQQFGQILPLLNLDETSVQFFENLPGDHSLQALTEKIGAKNHENLYRIFYLLECCKLIKWSSTPVKNQIAQVQRSDFKKAFESEKKLPSEISKAIHSEYMDLLNKDYFEIFGVDTDADEKAIDDSYRALRFRLHPDRFGEGFGGETKRVLDDMLSRIDKAYQTLTQSEARTDYLSTLKRWKEDSLADSKHFLDAQEKFRGGLNFLNQANFEKALQLFQDAAKIWNRGIEYHLYSLYCEFKIAQKDPALAEKKLNELKASANNHHSSDIGFLLLGHAYMAVGNIASAKEAYRAALKNNERNDEAANALVRLGDADLKKARISETIKTHKGGLQKAIAMLALFCLASIIFIKRHEWFRAEQGINEVSVSEIENIIPAIKIRQKGNIAKLTLKDNWLTQIPDPVLQGKCQETINVLSRYGIIEIWLTETQGKLKASCRKNILRRYK